MELNTRHASDEFPIDISEETVFSMNDDYETEANWFSAIDGAESPAYIRVKNDGSTYLLEDGTEAVKLPDTFDGETSEKRFRNDLKEARS
jgi:hypothetical protein